MGIGGTGHFVSQSQNRRGGRVDEDDRERNQGGVPTASGASSAAPDR